MPRPKKHSDNAARQRAYRERNIHKKPPKQSDLAVLSLALCAAVRFSAMAGNETALKLTAERDEQVLRNLISLYSVE